MYERRRTSRQPVIIKNVTFYSWQVGVAEFALISADERAEVRRNWHKTTYRAILDGKTIGERYQTDLAACNAIVKKLSGE